MRDGRVDLDFADGTYSFRLGWGALVELQDLTGNGPYMILNRFNSDDWRVHEISEVIRLGLIGGDKDLHPVKAKKLVERYVEARPPMENLELARVVLMVGLWGSPEDIDEKIKGEPVETTDGKLKAKDLYGIAAVIGYTPQEVNQMTVSQFMAAVDGYVKHHTPDDGKMSDSEADELFEWLKGRP